ncbi:hypothetical protein [Haloterrigena salifodinae]|uniref:hypothetical protein n=1 Tax=Haloterrigena salifodinae TaxID=2675099 RepID=UPI001E50399E|nr:hypothetical protein [Haloterrigena salifodinae]
MPATISLDGDVYEIVRTAGELIEQSLRTTDAVRHVDGRRCSRSTGYIDDEWNRLERSALEDAQSPSR